MWYVVISETKPFLSQKKQQAVYFVKAALLVQVPLNMFWPGGRGVCSLNSCSTSSRQCCSSLYNRGWAKMRTSSRTWCIWVRRVWGLKDATHRDARCVGYAVPRRRCLLFFVLFLFCDLPCRVTVWSLISSFLLRVWCLSFLFQLTTSGLGSRPNRHLLCETTKI